MKSKLLWFLASLAFVALVWSIPSAAESAITETNAFQVALRTAKEAGPSGRVYDRNNKRDVDLERMFKDVVGNESTDVPFIFRFWCDVCTEGRFETIVAVTPEGRSFNLKGKNGLKHFQMLSEELRVGLHSKEDVEHYLNWYLAVDPENRERDKVNNVEEVKAVAKRKFEDVQAFAPPAASFDNWWGKHEKEARNLSLREEITTTSNGFRVRFYVLSNLTDKNLKQGPSFQKVSLEFSVGGRVTDPKKRTSTRILG